MVTRCKNLEQMLREGKIPIRGGWWIDAYNMVVSPIAGTIKARINHNNLYFVTELYEEQDIAQPRTRRDVQDNQGQLPQGECSELCP